MGKSFNFKSSSKKRWSLVNRCYLCQVEEESIDVIFLHCVKIRVL